MYHQPVLEEDSVKMAYIAEFLSRRKQYNVKRLLWAKPPKEFTIEQWNKVLWIDESKFEIILSKKRSICSEDLVKELHLPCIIPTLKHGGDSFIVCVGGYQLNYREFTSGEGQTESNRLSQHTAASSDPIWNTAGWSRICTRVR